MNLAPLIGLSGISLLLSAIVFSILSNFNMRKPAAYILTALLFTVSFLPIAGYTLNEYLRGLFNDLSFTSIILLGYYIIRPQDINQQSRPVFIVLALTGIVFYPAAIGFGPIDPYAWGYFNKAHGMMIPIIFLAVLAALMTLAFIRHYTALLACLVLSSIAFQLGLLESHNLWDYFIDPLICLYAIITILSRWLASSWSKTTS